jgi:hypothetical protein
MGVMPPGFKIRNLILEIDTLLTVTGVENGVSRQLLIPAHPLAILGI